MVAGHDAAFGGINFPSNPTPILMKLARRLARSFTVCACTERVAHSSTTTTITHLCGSHMDTEKNTHESRTVTLYRVASTTAPRPPNKTDPTHGVSGDPAAEVTLATGLVVLVVPVLLLAGLLLAVLLRATRAGGGGVQTMDVHWPPV